MFSMLYAFFWVIPRRLKFICRRFGTLCLFHLHRQVDVSRMFICRRFGTLCLFHLHRPMKMEQSVPKSRHINSRRRGITQKKAYNIGNKCLQTQITKNSGHYFLPNNRLKKEISIEHCVTEQWNKQTLNIA